MNNLMLTNLDLKQDIIDKNFANMEQYLFNWLSDKVILGTFDKDFNCTNSALIHLLDVNVFALEKIAFITGNWQGQKEQSIILKKSDFFQLQANFNKLIFDLRQDAIIANNVLHNCSYPDMLSDWKVDYKQVIKFTSCKIGNFKTDYSTIMVNDILYNFKLV